jgi:hypothetical protein
MALGNEARRARRFDKWQIETGLDFEECFLIRDPTQDKIPNPDFDPDLPVDENNPEEVYPPKDLNGYSGRMDIRNGTTQDSSLIHRIESPAGGMTFNDPAVGFVKLFIDGSITGAGSNDPENPTGIRDYANTCSHFDLILDSNQPGEPARRILLGDIPIIEIITEYTD